MVRLVRSLLIYRYADAHFGKINATLSPDKAFIATMPKDRARSRCHASAPGTTHVRESSWGPCEPAPISSLARRYRYQPGGRYVRHRRDHDGWASVSRDTLTYPGTNDGGAHVSEQRRGGHERLSHAVHRKHHSHRCRDCELAQPVHRVDGRSGRRPLLPRHRFLRLHRRRRGPRRWYGD